MNSPVPEPGRLLAADIGNSHTVLGLVRGGEVAADWRVSTVEHRSADEWAVLLRGLLGPHEEDLTGIVVCSAVPAVLREWRIMLRDRFPNVDSLVVEPGVRTGIPVLTDNPREVGTDRIVNALAAATIFGGPAIVVDFGGTATTFDVVNSAGQYVGGAITPGIEISAEALERHGAQLRMVELRRPRTVIARNTVEALQSGMVFGVASQVDGMVGRMMAELAGESPGGAEGPAEGPAESLAEGVAVVATGHLAPLVYDECRCFTAYEPWLTLRGLELVYTRNR